MKKKLLAVLMTGIMAASFAGTATVVSADSGDDNKLTVWACTLRIANSSVCALPHFFHTSSALIVDKAVRI